MRERERECSSSINFDKSAVLKKEIQLSSILFQNGADYPGRRGRQKVTNRNQHTIINTSKYTNILESNSQNQHIDFGRRTVLAYKAADKNPQHNQNFIHRNCCKPYC